MKINFILPFKRMTGGIRVIYTYANYLIDQGHDVVCYVPMISYRGRNQTIFYRIKASLGNTLKNDNWFDKKFDLKRIPVVSEKYIRDADVVIATAWQTAYDVANFSSRKGHKFYFIQDYEIFNGGKEEVEASYRLPLTLITVTRSLKKAIQKFTDKTIYVVYNGLSDNEYLHTEKISHKDLTLMMMYHESEHKKSQEGLQIIAKLKKRYPDMKINIFGRRIPEKLPDTYNVLINPEREKILKMYQESDVYLFTSEIEAWGLPIVEAMANKCAVVGRSRGALLELSNGQNTIVVEELSEIYNKVVHLQEDRLLLAQVQNEGYKTVIPLNWSNSCLEFEKIISGVYIENGK
ncbi:MULTISPECIES: glycosyltransferase family 4 protein [Streptococcus]|jgi:glycosyltransferase, group 1 family|uniref:Glycosyltransferase family 4 protein n=1 Tax=Streptococcus oralis TaxID=1303 RepID=A0A7T3DVI5_STROR|nr:MULTISPECIES: glycosyltransferase family 4 protein [Streptococcus]EHI77506.1 glycosyltransferase, group 1 family protein [Streptococcus sp. oral taxon 058 str. F0407]QPS97778.1 glycosyltransferase family 4 protein [Streptococcus oralis]